MAEGEMFGSAVGGDIAERGMLDLARGGAQINLMGAQEQHQRAEAEKTSLATQQERTMMELARRRAAQRAPGSPEPSGSFVTDSLDQLAQDAVDAGMVVKGADLAGKSSLIRQHMSAAANSDSNRRTHELKLIRDRLEAFETLARGSTDETSWRRNNAMFELQFGVPSPYSGIPYRKEFVDQLTDSMTSAKDKTSQKILDEEYKSRERNRVDMQGDRKVHRDIERERLTLQREREERLAKAGGGRGIGTPTDNELDQARALLKQRFPGLTDTNAKDRAAFDVASAAKELLRQNPALNPGQAMQRALAQEVAAGSFSGTSWLGQPKVKEFEGAGKTQEAPIDARTSRPATLIENRWYHTPRGIEQYLGGKKWRQAAPASNGGGDDGEED